MVHSKNFSQPCIFSVNNLGSHTLFWNLQASYICSAFSFPVRACLTLSDLKTHRGKSYANATYVGSFYGVHKITRRASQTDNHPIWGNNGTKLTLETPALHMVHFRQPRPILDQGTKS